MKTQSFLKTFSKIFPLPKDLSFNFVGVDLGKDFVKVVKLEDRKHGKVPTLFKEYKINKEYGLILPEPEYKDVDELVEILKNIKRDFGVTYVNVSVPEVRTYVYKTTLPTNVKGNIYDTLIFSIEENVPLSPEEVIMDYFVVDVNESEVEVVVTIISETIISLYTKLFEEAGLSPISFEPETHAISRAIIKKDDTGESLLLNIDSGSSNIAVIEKEIVQYTQIIPLTYSVETDFLNEDELKVIKEEIQKVIIYWETSIKNHDKQDLSTLYLVGALASSNKVLNYLDKKLPINVKFANVWTNCFDLNDYIPNIKAQESLKYATAVGLSLKKIK